MSCRISQVRPHVEESCAPRRRQRPEVEPAVRRILALNQKDESATVWQKRRPEMKRLVARMVQDGGRRRLSSAGWNLVKRAILRGIEQNDVLRAPCARNADAGVDERHD